MKLYDLYTRIVETTGLDVITLDNLRTAIKNCFADLTSRGYKIFKELHKNDLDITEADHLIKFSVPKNLGKTVYVRLFFDDGVGGVAKRVSLGGNNIACCYDGTEFHSNIGHYEMIYYVKGDTCYVEWGSELSDTVIELQYAYYERLQLPANFPASTDDIEDMKTCEIDIREEYEDALVFYAAYFYYSRYIKDTDKIQLYQSNYKYFVEDISHELAYQDEYNEGEQVITIINPL